MMIKVITLFQRKAGITPEQFSSHLRETHGPLAVKLLPQMKRHVQNHIAGEIDTAVDAFGEFWFESMDEFQRFLELRQSEGGRPIREDEDAFMDSTKTVSFVVDEVVQKEPPKREGMIKVISLEPRKAGVRREEYSRRWKAVGPQLVKLLPTMKGYVQNHLPPEAAAEFDGAAELWFDTMEDLQAVQETLASEEAAAFREEEEAFLDQSRIVPFLVEEVVQKG
jgi:uncharacterized protein (TIGR02118 family)